MEQQTNYEKDIIENEKGKEIYEEIISTFEKQGLIDSIIKDKILPELENKINYILDNVCNYKIKIELKDGGKDSKIKMYKILDNEQKIDVEMMSGYEISMINIIIRIALSNMSNAVKTNFIIIDEAFTFCDNTNRKKLKSLFEFLRKNYDWILLITHDDIIKDEYNMKINVVHDGKYSNVKLP